MLPSLSSLPQVWSTCSPEKPHCGDAKLPDGGEHSDDEEDDELLQLDCPVLAQNIWICWRAKLLEFLGTKKDFRWDHATEFHEADQKEVLQALRQAVGFKVMTATLKEPLQMDNTPGRANGGDKVLLDEVVAYACSGRARTFIKTFPQKALAKFQDRAAVSSRFMTRTGGRGLLAEKLKGKIEKTFEELKQKTMLFLWQHSQDLRVSALETQGCQLAQVASRVPALEMEVKGMKRTLAHLEPTEPEPTPPSKQDRRAGEDRRAAKFRKEMKEIARKEMEVAFTRVFGTGRNVSPADDDESMDTSSDDSDDARSTS